MLDAILGVGDTTEKQNEVNDRLCPQGSLCNGDDQFIKRSLQVKCGGAGVRRDKVAEGPALGCAVCTRERVYVGETGRVRGPREDKERLPSSGDSQAESLGPLRFKQESLRPRQSSREAEYSRNRGESMEVGNSTEFWEQKCKPRRPGAWAVPAAVLILWWKGSLGASHMCWGLGVHYQALRHCPEGYLHDCLEWYRRVQ